jgi:polyisoprenoid-binding protein YceI
MYAGTLPPSSPCQTRTVKNQTREVEFDATVEGAGQDPWGNVRVGVAVRGTINRTDWGLIW